MGAPQCRLSILTNGNVPCHYFRNFPVNFKIALCRLSILRNGYVPCRYFLNVPVDFKGVQCRLSILRNGHVALSNLRVKGPHISRVHQDAWRPMLFFLYWHYNVANFGSSMGLAKG